jgi:hypothetical protein
MTQISAATLGLLTLAITLLNTTTVTAAPPLSDTSAVGISAGGIIVSSVDTRSFGELHAYATHQRKQGVVVAGLSNCKVLATKANLQLIGWHTAEETGFFTAILWYTKDGTRLSVQFDPKGEYSVTDLGGQPVTLNDDGAIQP